MKILRIDMGAAGGPKVSEEPAGPYEGMGGRALTSTLVAKEVPPLCHPLGEDNKLVIAPGMLSGTAAAISGRVSVGCKSPLTGGIKEANSGGQPSQLLAMLGYAAVVLEGKPKDNTLYKVFISKDGVKITPDNSLRMLGNYDLVEKMKKEFGDQIACISVGQAGETKKKAKAEKKPVETRTAEVQTEADDLVKIEGIGPKVAEALKTAGIVTFAQLAESSVEDVQKIMTEAGLKMMNPEGWIEQAKLAAKGDWKGFEKLQEKLVGGRAAKKPAEKKPAAKKK